MQLKRRKNILQNKHGAALLLSIIAVVSVGAAAMFLPKIMRQSNKTVHDTREHFEALIVAKDVQEYVKYLLFYEKFIYTKNPEELDSDIYDLWDSSLQDTKYVQACGGRDFYANLLINGTVAGKSVFCPLTVRHPKISTSRLVTDYFGPFSNKKKVFKDDSKDLSYLLFDGSKTDISATGLIKNSPTSFIPYLPAQKILSKRINRQKKTGNFQIDAYFNMKFLTAKSGFRAKKSERFIELQSLVKYKSGTILDMSSDRIARKIESIMLIPTTVRDFAIFMPYPQKFTVLDEKTIDDGFLPDEGANKSDKNLKFRDFIQLQNGDEIYGKVYFNGDIILDKVEDLKLLPTFYDAVILGGSLKLKSGMPIRPIANNLELLRSKFRKSIISNFSADRFLLNGNCHGSKVGALIPMIENGAGYKCFDKNSTSNPFWNIISGQGVAPDLVNRQYYINGGFIKRMHEKNAHMEEEGTLGFITGGVREILIDDPYAFIMTPVLQITIMQETSIIGTVFTGFISRDSKFIGSVKVRSLLSISKGYTGDLTATEIKALKALSGTTLDDGIDQMNNLAGARSARRGLTSSLINMPVVILGDKK